MSTIDEKREHSVATAADLTDFELERVLLDDPQLRMVVMLGRLSGREGQAIVMASTRHPGPHAEALRTRALRLAPVFDNDVYYKFAGGFVAEPAAAAAAGPDDGSPPTACPDGVHPAAVLDVQVIHPCTEKHISKYTQQRRVLVRETPAMYRDVVQPFIAAIPAARIAWVHNMISKEKEAERMIFEDLDPETGFILHPDLKYDGVAAEGLYCVAIVRRSDLGSLRDLDAAHVPLLRNVRDRGLRAIHEKYGVEASSVRVYIHYYPSYYHLHVHFVHVANTAFLSGCVIARAHLLDDVIGNLEIAPDYYQRVSLTGILGETDPLYVALRDAGAV
jgi:m7GpppX diphosphatase